MEEGTFAGWLKQDGDRVHPGDHLFVLESDKAAQEIESLDTGIFRLSPDGPRPGDKVQVGQVLAYLMAEGEAPRPVEPPKSVAPAAGPAARRLARTLGVEIAQVAGSGARGRITEEDVRRHGPVQPKDASSVRRPASSPRARRVAAELGIDWRTVRGTGGNGRIRERDVRAATPAGGKLIPHSDTRRLIAARMVAGTTQAAPVTLTTWADATNLVNLREQFKASGNPVPTYTDLILKLAAVALKQHPLLQAQWRDEGLFVPERIDIAIAVDTDVGLLVPVVRTADRLMLRELAAQSSDLIAQARAGRLTPDQLRDATFTITNLGGLGVDAFTPIVNLPQSAVLGVGRIVREPAVIEERIVPRDRVTLSLTFDHRVVDGAPAARFLDTLRGGIENPAPWLIT
jgi:pyruvate dehydrogenase E2 component (dihydrolipoamide acetyltransferase)